MFTTYLIQGEVYPQGCYSFVINNINGDGIFCLFGEGHYSVEVNGYLVLNGDQFEISDRIEFGYCTNTLYKTYMVI